VKAYSADFLLNLLGRILHKFSDGEIQGRINGFVAIFCYHVIPDQY